MAGGSRQTPRSAVPVAVAAVAAAAVAVAAPVVSAASSFAAPVAVRVASPDVRMASPTAATDAAIVAAAAPADSSQRGRGRSDLARVTRLRGLVDRACRGRVDANTAGVNEMAEVHDPSVPDVALRRLAHEAAGLDR